MNILPFEHCVGRMMILSRMMWHYLQRNKIQLIVIYNKKRHDPEEKLRLFSDVLFTIAN